ncbi:MAG: PAS domain S-box protein [Rhizobiaceae bacterium]|nr:PAS domain S-box protein [Rhizobiaceae bacterium]MCV0406088.1 PAS domain S-box protein [Rhizobiaceae bacterium]
MARTGYSFIDVAALDPVRARLLRGDAIVVLAAGLDDVLWANGPGCALFGHEDIESIMGARSGLTAAQRRQIAATPGFPRIGSGRRVVLRLSSGFGSRAASVEADELRMPDGEVAIMLASPAGPAAAHEPAEIAGRVLSGFGGEGRYAALVDGAGAVIASTPGWSGLDLDMHALARDAATGEPTRKRMVRAGARSLPMGLARLAETPPCFLVVVLDEGDSAAERAGGGAEPAALLAPLEDAAGNAADLPDQAGTAGPEDVPPVAGDANPVSNDHAGPAPEAEAPTVMPEQDSRSSDRSVDRVEPSAGAEPAPAHSGRDDWYFGNDDAPAQRKRPAIRFVWRTDAAGRFSAISSDFARAVGMADTDLMGRTFAEVAAALDLDPDRTVAALLERRDTWSGRMVYWPIAGTRLRVPVDLAALPTYSREREFEGFRGFGVARMADIVEYADASDGDAPSAGTDAPAATEDAAAEPDPFQGERPAIAVAPGPDRRETDKVVRLAERRSEPARTLSPVETNAFREIGDRLKKFAGDDGETGSAAQASAPPHAADHGPVDAIEAIPASVDTGPAEDEPTAEVADEEASAPPLGEDDAVIGERDGEEIVVRADAPVSPEPGDAQPVDHDDVAAGDDAETPEVVQATDDDADAAEAAEPAGDDESVVVDGEAYDGPAADDAETPEVVQAADDDAGTAEAAGPASDEESVVVEGGAYDGPAVEALFSEPPPEADREAPGGHVPAAFHLPAADVADDVAILSRLPLPLLVHSGDVLHFANREFLDLTGYENLDRLSEAGGLDALIAGTVEPAETVDRGRMLRIRTAAGEEFAAEGHLQSVPWRGGKALLLALRMAGPAESGDDDEDGDDPVELRARLAEMRAIVDTATDGLVIVEPDGEIRSISRPAEALFGFDAADVKGKPFASLFALESQRAVRDYLEGLREPGVASVLNDGREVIGREAQGRFIPMFMTMGRLSGGGFCAVLRDITQWKRAEEELTQAKSQAERASSQKSDFLARISHEIRTPLNAIIGFSELMMDEKFGPIGSERYRDYLRDINRSGNHVLDLVNDLLDISKIEAGEQEMSYEAVSLNETLTETVALMQPQANRERVIIRSSFSARLPEIVADLRSIRQIALNLLSNAVRYTPAGGQVIISTAYEASGDVVMRVRDTGIGMTQAEIEQALKPFRRINALKRQRNDGTGLGLPLTKAMVEANRARFAISSTPGEGTLVEVTFPSTRVLAS